MIKRLLYSLVLLFHLATCGLQPAFAGAFNPGDKVAPSMLCPTEETMYRIAGYMEKGETDLAFDLAQGQCAFQRPMSEPWRVTLVEELDVVQVPDSGNIAIWKVTYENFPKPLYTILLKDGGRHDERVA